MAWEATLSTTSVAEDAYTPWLELAPKELAHVQVHRTDLGSADAMRIFVESSVDGGSTADEVALTDMEIPANLNNGSLSVFGVNYFRVGMENPVDTGDAIVVTISIRRDGGIA